MNYQKIYNEIIDRAKTENRKKLKRDDINYVYYEKHHVIPRSLNGTDDKYNLVLLTAREHFLCHWLLVEIYPDNKKLNYAFCMMCKMRTHNQLRYKPSSRIYEYAKSKIHHSEETILKIKVGNKNKFVSDETKLKIKAARKFQISKPHSLETKLKISQSEIGKFVSDETKLKIKLAKQNMSLETKQKMSIAAKNRIRLPMSESTKQKIRNTKKNISEETKFKLKLAWVKRKINSASH